jgi:hypothetical protein
MRPEENRMIVRMNLEDLERVKWEKVWEHIKYNASFLPRVLTIVAYKCTTAPVWRFEIYADGNLARITYAYKSESEEYYLLLKEVLLSRVEGIEDIVKMAHPNYRVLALETEKREARFPFEPDTVTTVVLVLEKAPVFLIFRVENNGQRPLRTEEAVIVVFNHIHRLVYYNETGMPHTSMVI